MLCGVCQHKHSLKGWDNTLSVPLRIFLTWCAPGTKEMGLGSEMGILRRPTPESLL